MTRHGTAQDGTKRHRTARNGTVRHCTALDDTERHGVARNITLWHGTAGGFALDLRRAVETLVADGADGADTSAATGVFALRWLEGGREVASVRR